MNQAESLPFEVLRKFRKVLLLMIKRNFILQNFDTQIFGFPVYNYRPNSLSEIENATAEIPADAGLVCMRTPKSWSRLMPKTRFRKIECLVVMESKLENNT